MAASRGTCPKCGSSEVTKERSMGSQTGDLVCSTCEYANTPENFANSKNSNYRTIGTATVEAQVTTIRKYNNGHYVIEKNGSVEYWNTTLDKLIKKLEEDKISYKIT